MRNNALLALAFVACTTENVYQTIVDSDAAETGTAPPLNGYCAGECFSDDDCGVGNVCRPGSSMLNCVADDAAPAAGGTCTTDADCAVRKVCDAGDRHVLQCYPSCRTDDDCLAEVEATNRPFCVNSLCEEGRPGDDCGDEGEARHVRSWYPRPYGSCVSRCDEHDDCDQGWLCKPLEE